MLCIFYCNRKKKGIRLETTGARACACVCVYLHARRISTHFGDQHNASAKQMNRTAVGQGSSTCWVRKIACARPPHTQQVVYVPETTWSYQEAGIGRAGPCGAPLTPPEVQCPEDPCPPLAISPLFQPCPLPNFMPLPSHEISSLVLGKEEAPPDRLGGPTATFQHADMHGIIGFLWDTEHHLQAILELPLSFFTAS